MTQMNARLMCDLLARATSNQRGKLELPDEAAADSTITAVLDFLVEQRWLTKDTGAGKWTVTPTGRLWFSSLQNGDLVKFYDYGGAVFLLNTRAHDRETIVWHKGRFATISVSRFPKPEHFQVRRENESITTSGGFRMEDALATACALIAEDLKVPQPPEPENLSQHMLNYVRRL